MSSTTCLLSKNHFQYLKGIAILAVIFSHIGNYSGKTWFTSLGGIGVAIFLFCSGYGLMTSYYQKGLKNFWVNKLITIYIPFAVVEIFSAIIFRYSLRELLFDLMFLKRLNPLGWYIQYLAVLYLLFYLVVRMFKNIKWRFIIWAFFSVISFVFLPNLYAEQAISFISGLFIAEINRSDKLPTFENKKLVIFWGGAMVFLSIIMLGIKQMPIVRSPQTHYLYTILNLFQKSEATAGIICVTSVWNPFKKFILWIGSISYSLYLVHGYFMYILGSNKFGNFYINSFVMLMISFTVAIGLNKLIKRNLKK